jgi:hypothetical protein
VDAIIYGRDLGPEGADFVSDERFEKIRFYLKHGKYPNGADRAEKSRLRSAATHYKLLPAEDEDERASGRDTEKLMLKDKEVVADAQRQYEIARHVHANQHAGINKTTAIITEKYHWVRIKETVSLVIKNCPECKEPSKPTTTRPVCDSGSNGSSGPLAAAGPGRGSGSLGGGGHGRRSANGPGPGVVDPNSMIERMVHFDQLQPVAGARRNGGGGRGREDPRLKNQQGGTASEGWHTPDVGNDDIRFDGISGSHPVAGMGGDGGFHAYSDIPVDPRILQPQSQPHAQPPLQDVHRGGLGSRVGFMRPKSLIQADVEATASMIHPRTRDPSLSSPCTTATAAPSSSVTLYNPHHDPQQHQQYMASGDDDDDDFEPDIHPDFLLLHDQQHQQHQHQTQHQQHQHLTQHQQHQSRQTQDIHLPTTHDDDEVMDFDPASDADGEEHDEATFDVDTHLNLHVNDQDDGNEDGETRENGNGNENENENEKEDLNL